MTILEFITPSRIGGAETYFLRLIAHLSRAGHRVIVVTRRDCALHRILCARQSEWPLTQIHGWSASGKTDVATLARLCRLIREERVCLVHTHLTTASVLGSAAARLCRVPAVCHVHSAGSKTWVQLGDYRVAVAQGVRQHLLTQGLAPSRISVLRYGIDLQAFGAPLDRSEARDRLGLPSGVPLVGVVGSLQKRKGHRFLLRALAHGGPHLAAAHAVFAGDGPLEGALRGQAKRLGVADRVHFVGFQHDVIPVLSACDLVTLPSRKEGMSIAIMEAMALRRPVVVTRVAGMPELVRHGHTGLVVPAWQWEPLAEAIESLLADPVQAQRMALNGRAWLEENLDQQVCLAKLDAFLLEVHRTWQKGERVDCATWGPASQIFSVAAPGSCLGALSFPDA